MNANLKPINSRLFVCIRRWRNPREKTTFSSIAGAKEARVKAAFSKLCNGADPSVEPGTERSTRLARLKMRRSIPN